MECVLEALQQALAAAILEAEGIGEAFQHQRGIPDRGQVDEHDPIGKAVRDVDQSGSSFQGQASLAHACRPGQDEQTRVSAD
jgi:hypothetical protein